MPKFITRVELHQAKPEHYKILHDEMTKAKFHKYVADDQGNAYELPSAEYMSHGPAISVIEVRNLAMNAANKTGCKSWVFTCEYSSAAWSMKKIEVLPAAPGIPANNLYPNGFNPLTGPFGGNALTRAIKGY
jgi:hypothetical protein